MVERTLIASYAEAWEEMYGEGGRAEAAARWFESQFSDGHATSIRPLLERIRELVSEEYFDMAKRRAMEIPEGAIPECNFHPRALDLLLVHGMDYAPDIERCRNFKTLGFDPLIGQCFGNSWSLMRAVNNRDPDSAHLAYVEGLVYGYCTKPVLHAWNSFGISGTRALDWSHYVGCEWSRYFGICISEHEHESLRRIVFPDEPSRPVSLLDLHFYPFIEEPLTELLAARGKPVSS